MGIIFATGPSVSKVSKEQAIAAVKKNPEFPKGADDVTVEELDGHWVAAIHVAEFPPGGPADSSEEGPGPKSEGPDDTAPEPHDSDDGGDDEGSDGPPKPDHGDGGDDKGKKGGEEHQITAIHDLLTQIATALGIPIGGEGLGESPVPGEEPPMGPPGGPPGPPSGHPPGGPDQTVQHIKSLKPGEVPPGATPVGAPAFASTHPWGPLIGIKAAFEVEERIPPTYTAADVDSELTELARGTGYKVSQVRIDENDQGHRIAKALVSAY